MRFFYKILFFFFFLVSSFCEEDQSLFFAFVKGDIASKTVAVRASTGAVAEKLSELSLDFCIQNAALLPNDRELSALAVASVLAVPKEKIPLFSDRFVSVFALFNDDTVRSSILERLSLSVFDPNVRQKTISLVGVCFDEDIFFGAKCLSVIKNSEGAKKFPDFCAELAENALFHVIDYVKEHENGVDSRAIALQLSSLSALSEAEWTRAADLVAMNFSLSVDELYRSILDDNQFAEVCALSSKIPSSKIALSLSDCLASFNSAKEKSDDSFLPSEQVLLAVINALGVLGDKAAFDNLLYATYLGYSEEVVASAREALSKLKW